MTNGNETFQYWYFCENNLVRQTYQRTKVKKRGVSFYFTLPLAGTDIIEVFFFNNKKKREDKEKKSKKNRKFSKKNLIFHFPQ
jgi:hypothetical protein